MQLYDKSAYHIFNNLSLTGARFNDIMSINNWYIKDKDFIILKPNKGNNERVFKSKELDSIFLSWIEKKVDIKRLRSYSTCNRYFIHLFPINPIIQKKKRLTTHIFRHVYAKNLKKNDLSDEQIQKKLGEKELKSAQNYIYSTLYTK